MYNLFVTVRAGQWRGAACEYDTLRVINKDEGTDPGIVKKFGAFGERTIKELMSNPCLFFYEKGVRGTAKIGWITDIKKRKSKIRVQFEIDKNLPPIPISKISKIRVSLDISDWELDRTHWSVKDVDLFAQLVKAGIYKEKEVKQLKTKGWLQTSILDSGGHHVVREGGKGGPAVINIFLSGPRDTESEMLAVGEAIDAWNAIHSETYQVIFTKSNYKIRASAETGKHAQEVINDQALSECDYLFVVFKSRFGTPTNKHGSGTEHEYEWFKENKPIGTTSLYFSSKRPRSVDSQYQKVLEFKKRVEVLEDGLYEKFNSKTDLQRAIEKRLSIIARLKKESGEKKGLPEKTKFDYVFEFLDSKMAEAKTLSMDSTLSNQKTADFFDKTFAGIKTALKEEHVDFFTKFLQPRAAAFKMFDHPTSTHIPACKKYLDDCVVMLNSIKKRITPADLNGHLEPADLNRYLGTRIGIEDNESLFYINPGYERFTWSWPDMQLFIQMVNKNNYPVVVKDIGFIHGNSERYGLTGFGEDTPTIFRNRFLPIQIPAHSSPRIIISINHIQWNDETKKVTGVYVVTKEGDCYYGSDEVFNEVVENWKKKAGPEPPPWKSPHKDENV